MTESTRPPHEVVIRERETFIVLQHLYTWAEVRPTGMPVTEVASELGMPPSHAESLLEHLLRIGFASSTGSREVAVTAAGAAYIEHLAWRRRTVRMEGEAAGDLV